MKNEKYLINKTERCKSAVADLHILQKFQSNPKIYQANRGNWLGTRKTIEKRFVKRRVEFVLL